MRCFPHGLYYLAIRKCRKRGYLRCNLCGCRHTLQKVSLLTLPLRYDSWRMSRNHQAINYTIAWTIFSNYIRLWIAFHLLVVGKPYVLLSYWATTEYRVLLKDRRTDKETKQHSWKQFTQLCQLPTGWRVATSSTRQISLQYFSLLFNWQCSIRD